MKERVNNLPFKNLDNKEYQLATKDDIEKGDQKKEPVEYYHENSQAKEYFSIESLSNLYANRSCLIGKFIPNTFDKPQQQIQQQ